MGDAARAELSFGPVAVEREGLSDGSFVLRSKIPLERYAATLGDHLIRWAGEAPDRVFLAERDAPASWRSVTYGQALKSVRAIAQALIDRGLDRDRPVMILSGNGVDHGLLQQGALYAGFPVAPVSVAYSLRSQDFGKLKHVAGIVRPQLVFAENGALFSGALDALDLDGVEVVVSKKPPEGREVTSFEALAATAPTDMVEAARAETGPQTIAKILFTSGSTGLPKGVINTQNMLCSNQQALAQIWPFLTEKPPVLVDWLPWNHTFGGNYSFNMILRNGGSLYIDNGAPAPGLIDNSIANLADIAPTLYFNVPRGFEMVVPYLERDAALRDHFFSRLDTIFYAAAALSQEMWKRIEDLSMASRGEKVAMTSAWGSTETAPLAAGVHFPIDRAGVMGTPIPGTELKMVPNAGKQEIRVRGPNVTPGYFRQPELTDDAFDADGFYRIGDAAKLADPDDPSKGVIFDGRIAEDFKLSTGTWVNVGMLRTAIVGAAAPTVQDAVLAGHDRSEVGLLLVMNPPAAAALAGLDAATPMSELAKNDAVRASVRSGLAAHNAANPASSTRVARALFLTTPLDIDADEITDKGYINQRAVLEARADAVKRLFSDDEEVIVFE